MPYADVRGQRIGFEDTGGDGPPIVLNHGVLTDRRVFAPHVEELRDVYRVIAFDQRGSGDTEFDGQPFTSWDLAGDLFALLDRLGIERAVVGGTAEGGYVALRAALLHPDRVRALILMDTQARADNAEGDDVSDRMDELAMPVLLVHGTENPDIPVARAHEICAAASDCRGVVEVQGAGLAASLTHPQVVHPAIREFLEGLPA